MSQASWTRCGVGSRALATLLLCAGTLWGCALPGQLYTVAPVISGKLHGDAIAAKGATLSLRIRHRESPNLYHHSDVPLARDGAFAFEAVRLAIAGHEYSKYYRVYLHLRVGDEDRVVWRAEYSRRELGGGIELDCDLERRLELGQPCRVVNPLAHPWLIENGRRSFSKHCAGCHGDDGSGPNTGERVAGPRPPDLREIAARRGGVFDRTEVAQWIEGRSLPPAHGTRSMPIWGERLGRRFERYVEGDALIGVTLDPLVTFLLSLQRGEVRLATR